VAIPLKHSARVSKFAGEHNSLEKHSSWYREFAPSSSWAADAIGCTWEGKAGWTRSLRLLPDACADLVWDGERLMAIGPSASASCGQLRAGDYRVGVRLRCGGGAALIGVDGRAMRGKTAYLRDLWGSLGKHTERRLHSAESRSEQRRVLEESIAWRIDDGSGLDRLTLEAARRIRSSARSIERVAIDFDLNPRELRRRFAREIGLGPKTLQRIGRFDRLIARIPDLLAGRIEMATLALELGYADQAHMCRECLAFSGSSPAALAEHYRRS
jgi:AraC-like DNA-binding protein